MPILSGFSVDVVCLIEHVRETESGYKTDGHKHKNPQEKWCPKDSMLLMALRIDQVPFGLYLVPPRTHQAGINASRSPRCNAEVPR
ncbi:hypothetical protein CEP54_004995 [Fusarium duplospermum]|uniref:Uncharacterized protein n=1 Tax=Fusarium duplospermum TaxID=1325734 RepID=A0A428QF97_9HYPO|nr:hypothetical protein CEP54_004995 [Fusarium duplospermum]